jgi:hypothetical protein
MYKYLFTAILLAGFTCSFSQTSTRYKFRSELQKKVWLDKNGDYETSTDWQDSINIVVIEITAKRVSIYGNVTKTFDLTKSIDSYSDEDFYYYLFSPCIDKEGIRCNVRFKLKKEISKMPFSYLYIDYKNIVYQYALKGEQ